jgi:signal transduction histidine kinase
MGFVLAQGQPVMVADMASERRFAPSPIHRQRGIASSALLVVPGPSGANERPYGVLGAHATMARSFSPHEVDFLRAIATVVGSAISRRSSERQLRDAQERAESARLLHAAAEEASRAKDEFMALLGHELRNPLAPIVTALELLHLRGAGEGRELEIIERHVQHLTRLVDDLLDVSRVVRGKLELHPEPHEMATVVKKGVEMASPLLEQRRQQFTLDVAATGLTVLGDEARLAQVVANLVTNAAKYTPPGGRIWLTVRAEPSFVVMTVADTGIGITRELLPRIFDVFTQGPRTADRAEGGLGLGLALVKRIVALHGGTVAAHSDGPGQGTEFVVRLPRLPKDATPAAEPKESERVLATRRPHRVLIVDDNADAAETLAAILEAVGHDVDTAGDALQALRISAVKRPEIAILDIGLPVIDGYELAVRLQQRFGADLRLYAVTGYGQDSDRARAQAAGFKRHFVKPVETEELLRAIEDD